VEKLIKNHLLVLNKISSHFNIEVFLPYGHEIVMDCASKFNVNELIDNNKRKKPIYDIAKRNNVSQEILERRKFGLVSAFDYPD